jgi:phosphonate transport system ATP-binding protein
MSNALATALGFREQACSAAAIERVAAAELAAVQLSKSFDRKTTVLNNVSFEIFSGEAVALIGANGSGKSTLLRCCVGLIPIDSGKARLFGQDLSALRAHELRKIRSKVGFVFQQHNLVPRLTVLSNVLHGSLARTGARGWLQALAPREERERAMHCLDLVGLADLAERRADRLSGGQSQRVAIARALMQQPQIIIADEPVASLDPKAAEEIMESFTRLIQRINLTFLFTSHNLQHALAYAGRLLGLYGGILTLDGPTQSQNLSTLRQLYELSDSHH